MRMTPIENSSLISSISSRNLRLDSDVESRCRLVGDEHTRIVDQRHRDHYALAHPAGVLVRIVGHSLPRARDANPVEQLGYALARYALWNLLVGPNRLDKLISHPKERMERREGVLEDHRDLFAADALQLASVRRDQVDAVVDDLAGDGRAVAVDQTKHRQAAHALARARFADDAEGLAFVELVGEAVNGFDDAVMRREVHGKVAHLQNRRCGVSASQGESEGRGVRG